MLKDMLLCKGDTMLHLYKKILPKLGKTSVYVTHQRNKHCKGSCMEAVVNKAIKMLVCKKKTM
jgi:hypothetical protein